jgi:glutathione synthase/RimK-type ligase-like ATP-grasp enzyme
MARIGFASTLDLDFRPPSDVATADALGELGHDVTWLNWDEGELGEGLDLVVIRSCWNYHLHVAAFRQWLSALKPRVLNPIPLMCWNMDKRYLLDVAPSIRIVPTVLIELPTPESIRQAMTDSGWSKCVAKPTIGASAHGAMRITPATTNLPISGPMLLQPFIEAVQTEGEYALMFFDGRYSHAYLKTPAAGDYRVQEEHGGRSDPVEADAALVGLAVKAIESLPELPTYARIDIVDGMIMEIELIEPELYVYDNPAAARAFAKAIAAKL